MKNKIFACICLLVIAVVGVMTVKQYMFSDNKDETDATIEKSNSDTLQMELMAYLHATNQFSSISTAEVYEKIAGKETFAVYVGRATCQYCRKLVPILEKVVTTNEFTLFYLDSENTENDLELKEFRNQYGIDEVPVVIVFDSNENFKLLKFDDEMNEKETMERLEKVLLHGL